MIPKQTSAVDGGSSHSVQTALGQYMQHAPRAFAVTHGAAHSLTYANEAFCKLAGVNGHKGAGKDFGVAAAAPQAPALIAMLDRAFREGVNILDEKIPAGGVDAPSWQCSVWPVMAKGGKAEALGVEIRESAAPDPAAEMQRQLSERLLVSALRERGLAEDAEAARRRAIFLAEAGRLLAESVDQISTLVTLTKLALPGIGAWCIVDVINEHRIIGRHGIYHPDPEKQILAKSLDGCWLPHPDDPFGAAAMLRGAKTISISDKIELVLAASAGTAETLHTLRKLGIGCLLTVPLIARNKLLGAMTFINAEGCPCYAPDEVRLAEDLAERGALALDNAQVYDVTVALKQGAETANRAKTAFLGAMSHELRTPLNAIGGYIELLDMGLRGPVTKEQRADFARVRTNQQHLTLLITEILNFSRVGSGNMIFAEEDIDASAVMAYAIGLVEPLFAQKGLVFEGSKGGHGVIARADEGKVTQILVNLLSNAIKYTPRGGRVSAACSTLRDRVMLSVTNSGEGIPPGKLESIFEPFVQLKEGLADREGGVGLGLAISRDLARAMKGDLTVESGLGDGARFTLSLPCAGEQEEAR
ncbi:MAG: GAF domain-containing sensor histidine kinase [Gemmatimonadaceae bacterium]|nr:GAF domain-containing sensor histidine kinase [Gemmatimonadaceae bacterium]